MPRKFEMGPSGEMLEVRAQATSVASAVTPARSMWGWFGPVMESFAGAWQRDIVVESTANILAFSAVYACINLIASDISKLRIKLMEQQDDLLWDEVTSRDSPFWPVLRKPNRYQTRIQFLEQWVVMKLIYGNAFILKERDRRSVVVALYVLDSRTVTALVAPDGEVFYELGHDNLTGVSADNPALVVDAQGGRRFIVPASEIIHDRNACLWHPLCGVSPIYACGVTATQGIRIQGNSEAFFKNMSRPSGQLTAPGKIGSETADRLKKQFEDAHGGANLGRIFVSGDGLKYEAIPPIPAQDAQLIEQLAWTVEDVARAFGVPLYKIQAGANPTFNNVGSLNQEYYAQALQKHIESIEVLLDEGLDLGPDMGTELDLAGLLRMDPLGRAEVSDKLIKAGVLSPNEARADDNRHPVEGGDTPYLQVQNYSLKALAKRDASDDPFGKTTPAPAGPPPGAAPEDGAAAAHALMRKIAEKFEEAEIVQA